MEPSIFARVVWALRRAVPTYTHTHTNTHTQFSSIKRDVSTTHCSSRREVGYKDKLAPGFISQLKPHVL